MDRYITGIMAALLAMSLLPAPARTYVLNTKSDRMQVLFDGGKKQDWKVIPSAEAEKIETTAAVVTFVSGTDTLNVSLAEWEHATASIVNDKNDTMHVRVCRRPVNLFENPSPELRNVSPSGLLSREQALFDIDALVYGISDVHPDMFSECSQTDFFRAVGQFKSSVADSISVQALYLGLSPIVAMLGDGHTHLLLPEKKVMDGEELFMPLYVHIMPDRRLVAAWSIGAAVPSGSEVLSVNGVEADTIVGSMMPFESGERDAFRLMRVDDDFTGLFHLMYPADKYTVVYRAPGSRTARKAVLLPVRWSEIESFFVPQDDKRQETPYYTYTVDERWNTSVMDFRSFWDEEGMKRFAESMFSDLRQRNISNLIIDLRENGGGSSYVGDALLRYICPEPFSQMDRVLTRLTPLTLRLLNTRNVTASFGLTEVSQEDYIRPLSADEGFYNGKVYLLTSAKTFSAAASFAWVFSQCGIGTIIGEETGGMNVSYGDKVWYTLPLSGLECGISFKRFWQFRADESSIHGALPDVAVPASDALEKAFSIIKAASK